jgi:hypothetical protein
MIAIHHHVLVLVLYGTPDDVDCAMIDISITRAPTKCVDES